MSEVIKLYSQTGPTIVHIDVRIEGNGDLQFSGQDLGEMPEQIFGKDDYEYFLRIPAAEKDRVLLALIEKVYRGNASVMSEFRELLESRAIPCEFHAF